MGSRALRERSSERLESAGYRFESGSGARRFEVRTVGGGRFGKPDLDFDNLIFATP